MGSQIYEPDLRRLASELGLPPLPEELAGVNLFLPFVEKMRADGAIVILKFDGERGPDDSGPYTAVVTGQILQGEAIRTDAQTVEDALGYIVVNYARRFWWSATLGE